MARSILHVDMNNCYASIELLSYPELRDKPVVVGGDESVRHGIVLAKNEAAKRYGIQTAQTLWQARKQCPGLIVLPPHHDLYHRFSQIARSLYSQYTDLVEPFGLDEAWLDVTGSALLFGSGERIAQEIRRRVRLELGLTVSVGVSFNKVFAKLASDMKKPDAVTVLSRENFRQRVWPLPVEALLFIGPSTREKLYRYGINTIGRLAQTPAASLESWFGKAGHTLHSYANGLDDAPVHPIGWKEPIKSIGNSTTTAQDLHSPQEARSVLWMLCESVAQRLRQQGLSCSTVQLHLRDSRLVSMERQTRLNAPTDLSDDLFRAAMALLTTQYAFRLPLRSLGVRAGGLCPSSAPCQLSLFPDETNAERRKALEQACDGIRSRYGSRAISRAVLLKGNLPVDPS